MDIKTGFGYYVQNGIIVNKYSLPVGTHPDPGNGITFVEVVDQTALDAIVVPPTPDEVAAQTQDTLMAQIQSNRDAYVDALINNDTATQSSIQTSQAALISQAIAANVALPITTISFANASRATTTSGTTTSGATTGTTTSTGITGA